MKSLPLSVLLLPLAVFGQQSFYLNRHLVTGNYQIRISDAYLSVAVNCTNTLPFADTVRPGQGFWVQGLPGVTATVSPSAGDSINGDTADVVLGNMTMGIFLSDGISVWSATYGTLPPAFNLFDAGQFDAGPFNTSVAFKGGITNAAGANVSFVLSDGSPVVFQTTNSANQIITLTSGPSMPGREKSWIIRLTGDGIHTMTFGGSIPALRSGTFVNPPPAGLNEYYLENINGALYYDVLRPGFSASQVLWGRNSSGAGDVEQLSLSQVLGWSGPNLAGDILYFLNSTNVVRLPIGPSGYQLFSSNSVPMWLPPSVSGNGFDYVGTGQSLNQTPLIVFTKAIDTNQTVYLTSLVAGGGPTNSMGAEIRGVFRREASSATTIATNATLFPSSAAFNTYWFLNGNNANLYVVGLTNTAVNWDYRGWQQIVANGTNAGAFVANTAVMDGSFDYGTNGTQNGWVDGPAFTWNGWVNRSGGDGTLQGIIRNVNGRFLIEITAANQVRVHCATTGGTTSIEINSTNTITSASGYVWLNICMDTSDPTHHHIYWNGVDDNSTVATFNTGSNIDLNNVGILFGTTSSSGLNKLVATTAEFWLKASYLNSPGSFASAGHPVSLGLNGELPAGTPPQFYYSLSGSGNSWANDSSGNANHLVVTGTWGTGTPP